MNDMNDTEGLNHGSEVGSVSIAPYEYAAVYEYLGKNRYLQASFCKSVAKLYLDQYGPYTTKYLTNIAAKEGNIGLLGWSKGIGCCWDESVFESGAKGGSVDVVRWLVNNDCPMPDGDVAWLAAAEKGCLEVLRFAHESKYLHEFQPLCEVAAENGHLCILKWVYEIEDSNHFKSYTCQLAARGGSMEIIRWLREIGCGWDEAACWDAIEKGKLDTLKWLISNGCAFDVDAQRPTDATMLGLDATTDTTMLAVAASKGHIDIMKFLINECCADVNYAPVQCIGFPLFNAVLKGKLEAVRLLLDSGANASTTVGTFTVLRLASVLVRTEIIEMLRDAGARDSDSE